MSHTSTIQSMKAIFEQQRQLSRTTSEISITKRKKLLNQLQHAIKKHCISLCQAVNEDFGHRATTETKVAEIIPCLEAIQHVLRYLTKWTRTESRQVPLILQPAKAKVMYQPLGVIGIICPWNYPIAMALNPLIGALAAGNRVLIKMSEYTPHTAAAVKDLLAEVFPTTEVAVLCGGVTAATAFAKLPFDHLLFTGSTAVGKQIMAAAATNLTPVTLELGGKSPVIIDPSAPLASTCKTIAFGKGFNAGQTCIAPDYILCPEHLIEEFVSHFITESEKLYPYYQTNDDYTQIINNKHFQRLQQYLSDAEKKGATIKTINAEQNNADSDCRKIPLTVLLNTSSDMLVQQEEIFGPLLPIISYQNLTDALEYVNARPRPLALYYFGQDQQAYQQVLHGTHSGGVCINDVLSHAAMDDLPFGGIGASGMGQYHGREGFLNFSKAKPIVIKKKLNSMHWVYPPWGRLIHNALFKWYLKE